MLLSISEHLKKAGELKTEEEKIAYLQKNTSTAMRQILKYMYDPEQVKFLIPETTPPYKPSGLVDNEGVLYQDARRLKIFIKNGGYDNLQQFKREGLFIQILEAVTPSDAELLCHMIKQKPLPGLPLDLVKAAFPMDWKKT